MELFEICNSYRLLNGEGLEIKAGSLHLKVKRISTGWGFMKTDVAYPFTDVEVNRIVPDFEVSESNLYQSGHSDILVVAPVLPEKPVVLKNSGLRILPGQNMHFFVKIPLNLQFFFEEAKPDNLITEYPMFRLSDTWFGEPDEGEPAFALGSFYRIDSSLMNVQPWEAVCPVHILNNSNLLLEVQRLIIRVENLMLIRSGIQLLTSMIEIEYKGRDQVSSVSYHLDKAIHGEEFSQITEPRSAAAKSSLKINFHFIKNIYQW